MSVSDTAGVARRMYESMGFEVWGREPRALKWRDRAVDELHLVLMLDSAACT